MSGERASATDDAGVPAKLEATLASTRRVEAFGDATRPPIEAASTQLPNVIPRNDKEDGYRNGQ
jgi:hypothetical protein